MQNLDAAAILATTGEYSEVILKYTLDVALALTILVAGFIVSAWAQRAARRNLAKVKGLDDTLEPFIARCIRYTILIVVFVAVLAQFGVQTTSIIAVLGAAGIAIGLALQGTLANIAAGIMLLFLRPFRIDDYIDAEGISGTVEEIGLFVTEMRTFDGIFVSVPNSQIWNRTITNYSRNRTRRLDIAVGVGYGDNLDTAKKVLMDVIESDDRTLNDPAPLVIVKSLDDSAVTLEVRVWADNDDYWSLRWDLTQRIKTSLDEAGISIPFPQRDVHLHQVSVAD